MRHKDSGVVMRIVGDEKGLLRVRLEVAGSSAVFKQWQSQTAVGSREIM